MCVLSKKWLFKKARERNYMEWLSGGLIVIILAVFVLSAAMFSWRGAFALSAITILTGWLFSVLKLTVPDPTFIGAIFVFGTLWFWMLAVITIIIMLSFIEYESDIPATLTLLATLLLLQFLGDIKVFSYMFKHPALSALWLGLYLAVGILWALGKWYFYATNERRKYNKLKKEFLKSHDVDGDIIPSELKTDWKTHAIRYLGHEEIIPKFDRNETRFLMWMMHWPWSACWTLLDDPIKRLFKEIYHQLKTVGQKIANAAFKGVEKDLPTKDEEERFRKEQEDQRKRPASDNARGYSTKY